MSADLHGCELMEKHIALLRAKQQAIAADTMAKLQADMDAVLARIVGTPEREETVAELAKQRDAIRETIFLFHDATARN